MGDALAVDPSASNNSTATDVNSTHSIRNIRKKFVREHSKHPLLVMVS